MEIQQHSVHEKATALTAVLKFSCFSVSRLQNGRKLSMII